MDYTKFKVTEDKMLVEDLKPRYFITKEGLHLPDSTVGGAKLVTCKVLAVGPGRMLTSGQRVPITFGVGEIVQVLKDAGFSFILDLNHPDREQRLVLEGECLWALKDYIEEIEPPTKPVEVPKPTVEGKIITP